MRRRNIYNTNTNTNTNTNINTNYTVKVSLLSPCCQLAFVSLMIIFLFRNYQLIITLDGSQSSVSGTGSLLSSFSLPGLSNASSHEQHQYGRSDKENDDANDEFTFKYDSKRGHPLCIRFENQNNIAIGRTASSIWNSYLDDIYQASIPPDVFNTKDENGNIVNDDVNHDFQMRQRQHDLWIYALLKFLSPSLLQQGIRSLPNYHSLERIFTKVYLRLTQPEHYPPIKIIVLGGSITRGIKCNTLARELQPFVQEAKRRYYESRGMNVSLLLLETKGKRGKQQKKDKSDVRECAWPFRLERLLRSLLGGQGEEHGGDTHSKARTDDRNDNSTATTNKSSYPLFQIENLAVGGTHSGAAKPFLTYWLSSAFRPNGADIIISSYAANDNLPPAFHSTHNTTVDNFHSMRILHRNQEFLSAALSSKLSTAKGSDAIPTHQSAAPDQTTVRTDDASSKGKGKKHLQSKYGSAAIQGDDMPLVVFINDYLGNQQPSIIGDMSLDDMINLLMELYNSNMNGHTYGMAYISPVQMVRRLVYGNTTEAIFSPSWQKPNDNSYTVEVHYGLSGHLHVMWTLAYAMLQTTLDFCEENRRRANLVACQSCLTLDSRGGLLTRDPVRTESEIKDSSPCLGPSLRQLTEGGLAHYPPLDKNLTSVSMSSFASQQENDKQNQDQQMRYRSQMEITKPFQCESPLQKGNGTMTSVTIKNWRVPPNRTTLQNSKDRSPCIFAFLAAPLGTHQGAAQLQRFLDNFIIPETSSIIDPHDAQFRLEMRKKDPIVHWLAENDYRSGGFQNKVGLVATGPNAKVTFWFPSIRKPVRALTMHYLKSYGPKWEQARVLCTLEIFSRRGDQSQRERRQQPNIDQQGGNHKNVDFIQNMDLTARKEFVLEGFHNQTTSISYIHQLSLQEHEAPKGSSMRFRLVLVSGETFKINAMMLCDR